MVKTRFFSYALWLALSALAGLTAAFALTVEKIRALENPSAPASCDINPLVQCGANLASWQGALFGFPNPLLGLIGWPVVLTVAVLIGSGVILPIWFRRMFTVGLAGAFGFVLWLMYVSFFQLGTLCPWCMVTWMATIPAFVLTVAASMRSGAWGKSAKARGRGDSLWFWSPTVILLIVVTAAAVAQVQLNWIVTAF